MPELPEVETVRRTLSPVWVGRRVAHLSTTSPSYFFLTPPRALVRKVTGRCFESLERHGKYLVSALDDGSRLLLHLGMTGQLYADTAKSARLGGHGAPDQHIHLRFSFEDGGASIFFRDVRKFGKVQWLAPGESSPRLEKLGPDALRVTGGTLFEASRKRKLPVKPWVLDQSVVAGAGNIYADEALFRAGIRPTRRAQTLSRRECEALAASLRGILERAIQLGGSSISDYIQPDGADGAFQLECAVYGRGGEPCRRCGMSIERVVLAQRSTHHCRSCQK